MADDQLLTRDNTLLSRPNLDDGDAKNDDQELLTDRRETEFAVNCKSDPSEAVRAYVEAGIASATRRAYRADLEHFRDWGGDIPTTDIQLAAYLVEQAVILKVATLTRRLAAISMAHRAKGLPSPTNSPLVRAAMRGVRRKHGTAQRQAAPLLREHLFVVLGAMGSRLTDLRDRALLLIGFAGGLRRSELVAINFIDLAQVREGVVLTIQRSKTDQDGVGRRIGVPFGRTIHCPISALETWLSAARIEDGPVFRPVDRHERVSASRLSGEAVSLNGPDLHLQRRNKREGQVAMGNWRAIGTLALCPRHIDVDPLTVTAALGERVYPSLIHRDPARQAQFLTNVLSDSGKREFRHHKSSDSASALWRLSHSAKNFSIIAADSTGRVTRNK